MINEGKSNNNVAELDDLVSSFEEGGSWNDVLRGEVLTLKSVVDAVSEGRLTEEEDINKLKTVLESTSQVRTAVQKSPRGRDLLKTALASLSQSEARATSARHWKDVIGALGTFWGRWLRRPLVRD